MALTMIGGVKIPLVGLGTWQATNDEELETALNAALEIGYRHIDTATYYQNEHIIGRVLNKWLTSGKLKREDLFITTKLPMSQLHPDEVEPALKESLRKLQLDYVDLYLIHGPIRMSMVPGKPAELLPTDHLGVWKKMEEQVDAKRARTIGISNFGIHQIERIIQNSRIKPANTQVELHVYNQQRPLRDLCRKNNIVVVAYSSLGTPGSSEFLKKLDSSETMQIPNLLGDPVVTKIAQKHNRTAGQVLLRFLTQNDIVVIPKSVNPKRLKENFECGSFTLDIEDLTALEDLDKGVEGRIIRLELLSPKMKEHPEYPLRN